MSKYLDCTRSPWYSLIFVLPLWLLYELLAATVNFGHQQAVINGADAMLRGALHVLGVQGPLAGMLVIAVVATIWVCRADAGHRRHGIQPGYFIGMLAESGFYAFLFGGVVVRIMQLVLPGFLMRLQIGSRTGLDLGVQFMTSLGAGVYEELLFRVLLMGGLAWMGTRVLRMKPGASLLIAMVASSLLFSAFHYVGSLRDTFSVASFSFRFIAGMLLAIIYRVRGFGIAAYTHAFYDLLLVLQGVHG
jgi:membrane protease YdiL (CAAX protease family)